jgi:hypothetical protein
MRHLTRCCNDHVTASLLLSVHRAQRGAARAHKWQE